MSGPQTYQELSQAVLDEHRHIHFFLDRLQQAVDDLGDGSGDAEPLRRLPAVLASFLEHLVDHNRVEVDDGLLQSVLDVLPDAEDEILRRTEEHDWMVRAVSDARLRAVAAGVEDLPALREAIGDLVATVREHEQAEDALLERALAQESSTG